jgi:hypothetical protein
MPHERMNPPVRQACIATDFRLGLGCLGIPGLPRVGLPGVAWGCLGVGLGFGWVLVGLPLQPEPPGRWIGYGRG